MTPSCHHSYFGTTSHNNGNHGPRLLYMVDLGSSRAHYITPRKEARDDVIAADVSRNRRRLKFTNEEHL